MNENCPSCGTPLDQSNPLKCPHCKIDILQYIKIGLENLKKEKDHMSKEDLISQVEKNLWIKLLKYFGIFAALWSVLIGGGLVGIYFKTLDFTSTKMAENMYLNNLKNLE